jgi:hypothetical protein
MIKSILVLALITFVCAQSTVVPSIQLPTNYNALIEQQTSAGTTNIINLIRNDTYIQWNEYNGTNCTSTTVRDVANQLSNTTVISALLPIFQQLSTFLTQSGNTSFTQGGISLSYAGKAPIRGYNTDQFSIITSDDTIQGFFLTLPGCNITYPVRISSAKGTTTSVYDYIVTSPRCGMSYLPQAGSIFSIPPFCDLTNSPGNVTIPALSSSFHLVLQANVPELNATRSAEVFYDAATNRSMLSWYRNGTRVSLLANNGVDVIYENRVCTRVNTTFSALHGQIGMNFSDAIIRNLYNSSSANVTYSGQESVDGIPCNRWDVVFELPVDNTTIAAITNTTTASPSVGPSPSTEAPASTQSPTTAPSTSAPTPAPTTAPSTPVTTTNETSTPVTATNETASTTIITFQMSLYISADNYTVDGSKQNQVPVLAVLYTNASQIPVLITRFSDYGPFYDLITPLLADCGQTSQCGTPASTPAPTPAPSTTAPTASTSQTLAQVMAMGGQIERTPVHASYMATIMTVVFSFSVGIFAAVAYSSAKRLRSWRR